MSLKLHKYLVQAVFVIVDDDGAIVGEQSSNVATVFGTAALEEFGRNVDAELAEQAQQPEAPAR